jgi:hypothetical protein
VTMSVTFRGLAPGQVTTLTLTTPAAGVLARAAAPDGTATLTLTAGALTTAQTVTATAAAPGQICRAVLTPTRTQPTLTCHTRLPDQPLPAAVGGHGEQP